MITRQLTCAFLALIAGMLMSAQVIASEPFVIGADSSGEYVNANVDYFVDTQGMSFDQVVKEADFLPTAGRTGLGRISQPLWLRVSLQRRADAPSQWRLDFAAINADEVRFFAPDGKHGYTTQISGERMPFSTRPFPYSKFLYTIDLPGTEPLTFYLRVTKASGAHVIPLRVWQFEHWVGQTMLEYAVYGLCFGIMVGLALYNLLLYPRLRDSIFLLYFLVVASHVLLSLNLLGLGSQWLWPQWFDALPARSPLLGCLWAICAILFARKLLNGPNLNPWVFRILFAALAANAISILGFLFGFPGLVAPVAQNAPIIWFPLVLGTAAYRAWRGSSPAVYYLIGYGPVLLGIALLLMTFKGIVPANTFFLSFFLVTGAWEAVLFSQALAERVNLLKQEREAAEQHSREADAELAKIEQRRAYADELTGLANREHLRIEGDRWLASNFAPLVLVLNIDRFKAINDALGYTIGDAVLVETGRRLAALPDTIVGRLHSNQFCVICRQVGRLDELRQHIVATFAEPLSVDNHSVDVTLSVGVVANAIAEGSMAARLRNAEIALHAGRRNFTGWTHYAADMESANRADLALLSALRHAVDNNELRLHLQPKVLLADGSVNSAEALVRWQHPERGMVPPGDFIPFAEQSGGIRHLTRWVLYEAMRITRVRRESGNALQISVNLSMHDLRDSEFVAEIRGIVDATGANPKDIRLEITENTVMDDPTVMLEVMRALNEEGFSLSVDDFGTGYSSLAYLQKMPVTELKIDRTFVSGTRVGGDAETLLDSIIALGHRLGLTVVAEGAETVEEWELLRTLGCDYLQGWVVAKAMPVPEFDRWVAKHTPFVLHRREE